LAVAGRECQPGPSDEEFRTVPTYQYACTNPDGKHQFEVVQSFTDAPVSECPECGSPVRKVYGSVGVVFKGSGFYRTDSRSSASSSEAGSSSDGKKDGGTKDGGKKDGGTKDAAPAAASSSSSSNSSSTSRSSSSSNSSAATS
jgi:putative FmdB family regulatory protein